MVKPEKRGKLASPVHLEKRVILDCKVPGVFLGVMVKTEVRVQMENLARRDPPERRAQ